MNVIHSLTLAQMRAKPRRTLTTLIGVALSVAMLTAVFAGADSFLDLMRREAVGHAGQLARPGDQHQRSGGPRPWRRMTG